MIRMNPTVPTMTGTIIPMIRIRSASAPARNSFPKIRSVSSGRIPSTRSTGIVAASVHRVTFLYSRSSCSRSPRWCRSATNGLNVSETDVRNRNNACPVLSTAPYTPTCEAPAAP